MNGHVKLHKPESPAFNKGERWYSSDGFCACIERVERYGVDKWDVDVYYTNPNVGNGRLAVKNAWSFQVRYQHQADMNL